MASNFPVSVDSFTDPSTVSKLNSPRHSTQHSDLNDAVEKLEAKVGADSSAVTTSLDYKIRKGLGVNTAVASANVTFDCASKNIHVLTCDQATTLAVSNVSVGQSFIVFISATSYNVTWWSNISWPGGTAPSLTTTATHFDSFIFFCYSSGKYAAMYGGFDIIMT